MPDNPTNQPEEGPGSQYVNTAGILGMMAYLLALTCLCIYNLYTLWPVSDPQPSIAVASSSPRPSPSPTATVAPGAGETAAAAAASPASPAKEPTPSPKVSPQPALAPSSKKLLLLVILAGGLGGTVHAIRSLFWYVGNRDFRYSWLPMYVLLPFNGAVFAIAFHLVVLGGFVSDLSDKSNTWLGLLAIATLVGLFSQQAAEKLKVIASAIFAESRPGKNFQGPDSSKNNEAASGELKITGITPSEGSVAGGLEITITGKGFAKGATVTLGKAAADDIQFVDATSIKAKTPPGKQAGKVDVVVSNPDKRNGTLSSGFTYTGG